jgi:hypothetical protein
MSSMVSLDAVDALQTLLRTAMGVMDELRREGLLERLVAVLGDMRSGDREAILRILEHDAGARTHVDAANVWARFVVRPNPFAQLYTRTSQAVQSVGIRYLEAYRATVVGARLARSLPPWGEGGWEPETIDAWRRLSAGERAYVADVSRRVLAVLERNRRRMHV